MLNIVCHILELSCIFVAKTLIMKEFNSYLNDWNYSNIKKLIQEKGECRVYHKKDFFIRQNEISYFIGWVESGVFQYTYIDEEGTEHIVGYAFQDEFVCDYSSLMRGTLSLVNIQAITDCTVYVVSRHDIINYWEINYDTQHYGRLAAESLFETIYKQLLESYCTPTMRYLKLMKRCPDLKEVIPLKSIASYLGVIPETVSHIRKKILLNQKS